MIATYLVHIQIDAAEVEREAARNGYASLQAAQSAILADLEDKLHGAVKWRECVSHVGVQLFGADSPVAGASQTNS